MSALHFQSANVCHSDYPQRYNYQENLAVAPLLVLLKAVGHEDVYIEKMMGNQGFE